MPLDQEIINQQLALLAAHRRTLAHLMEQAAQFGGAVFVPPQTANGIVEARQQIRRIKAVLRKNSVQVKDEPNDKAPRQRKSAQPPMPGDVVSGDKVMGDKHVHIAQPSLAPALHQLRAPVSDFVGREREIDQLVQALTKTSGAASAIGGVRGLGGIGKTELAYVVANQLKDAFPDAQLVVELRGTSSSPLKSVQALRTVIHSFGSNADLPDDLSQLQGIYRAKLSGKRMLILADDAHDVVQVRPLLPPPGCALLVTSRNRFSLPGMWSIDLEVLPSVGATKLLLEMCPRIGKYAGELARLCGNLPPALRVSASLLKENDSRGLGRHLEQLRADRLKHLSDPDNADDPQTSVEASLRLSYDALESAAQQALCQMTVVPLSFDLKLAQEVVVIAGDTAEILELLRRRSLLEWNEKSKDYSMHDLTRAFAALRLENKDAVEQRWRSTRTNNTLDLLMSTAREQRHLSAAHIREYIPQPDQSPDLLERLYARL